MLYHYVPAMWGLKDIRTRQLKIATLDDVNDPFEWQFYAYPDRRQRAAMNEWREEMKLKYGFLSFSKTPENPVMWSHYADKHKGICLGFEVHHELITPVDYHRSRERLDLTKLFGLSEERGAEFFRKNLSTKFAHWKYEKEARVFLDLQAKTDGIYFADFHAENMILRCVHVGSASTVTKDEVLAALGDLAASVTITKMRLAFQTYRVVQHRGKAAWQ